MFTAAGFAKALAYWKLFLQGVVCTVCLSFLTVLFGFLLALLITGMRMSDFRPFRALALTRDGHERDEGFLAKLSRFNPIRFIASVYVELFRATPMVVQIMLVYYGLFNGVKVLPGFMLFGFIRFERFFPGVVALALNSGAYLSEIIRSGIQSIDGGQTEASRSLGMSKLQTMRFIILPQAIRNILPAIANEFVTIIKGIRHLLHHRRAGHHVRRQLRQGRDLPHHRGAGHRDGPVLLPDVPDEQGHRAL